jgi:hypothetical protein
MRGSVLGEPECETAKLFDQMQGEGPPSLEAFHTVLSAS